MGLSEVETRVFEEQGLQPSHLIILIYPHLFLFEISWRVGK